ncbi:hypothetical protein SOVF_167650, partial [Spinacia oleracea]
MGCLNKKYRNYRARLKADYYDIESTDEERLKEENRPPNVDKDEWEWLVEYFGSDEFKLYAEGDGDGDGDEDGDEDEDEDVDVDEEHAAVAVAVAAAVAVTAVSCCCCC